MMENKKMDNLIEEFNQGMEAIYYKAKEECNYNATRYLQMVREHGGLKTAKKLLASDNPQDGLAKLWECGCSHLTVEALVLKERYRTLFTDQEIRTAKKRLV